MPERWRLVLIAALCFLIAAGGAGYLILSSHVTKADFKAFAENQAGEFFKTRVRIGNIRPDFFNQIALTELVVGSDKSSGSNPYFVHIEKIVFRYNLLQLITQNFNTPRAIVLEAPKMILDQNVFPYDLFARLGWNAKGGVGGSTLKLKGGQVRIPWPRFHAELVLNDIQGGLEPFGPGKIQVEFKANASGVLSGELHLKGVIDVLNKTHSLTLKMDGIDPSDIVPLPFDRLQGSLKLENGKLSFDDLEGTIQGWQTRIRGSLWNFGPHPAFEFHWEIGKKDLLGTLDLEGDLAKGDFKAALQPVLKEPLTLQGKIHREDLKFFADSYTTGNGYTGSGKLDFESGDYGFSFQKESQRIAVDSNLKGLSFYLHLDLNHVKFYGLDLVTKMKIKLDPVKLRWEEHDWKFHGTFESEYFILEYTPLEDFRGSFELIPYAIKNFASFWGEVFQMDAQVNLQPVPAGKINFRVHGFDLKNVKEFASKPLPKDLGGKLEGKLQIEGALLRPEIIGNFNVDEGKIGKLIYDRGIIQFRGFPPYLALNDSRIFKGRTTLYLTGALDLSLENMFHAVQIETADKIVVWKGIQAHTSQGGLLEIEHGLEGLPGFAVESTQTSEDNPGLVVGSKLKF
ncbi:MAG: hypothetical protein HYZ83_04705 [Candidatus Omnitrophica bacterium]|nr:hypothetical protein [Candidatus Omnitrophota bacterium]